ncbi:hypothetical protein N9193_04775 [Pseudomonadales bacterium]|nr:hypothetical protein [Pseudomonadales bacterium]
MSIRKYIAGLSTLCIIGSSTAAEVSFTSQGLDFTINNDDPYNATINFSSYTPAVPAVSNLIEQNIPISTNVATVVEFLPLPNPVPFPPPLQTKIVTTTTTEILGRRELSSTLLPQASILSMAGGLSPLTVNPNGSVFFSFPAVGTSDSVFVQLQHTEILSETTTTLVQTFAGDVLVNTEESVTTESLNNLAIDEIVELQLKSLTTPGEVFAENFPNEASFGSGIQALYYSDVQFSGSNYLAPATGSRPQWISLQLDSSSAPILTQFIPIPTTAWLFGSALAGLLVARSKNKK